MPLSVMQNTKSLDPASCFLLSSATASHSRNGELPLSLKVILETRRAGLSLMHREHIHSGGRLVNANEKLNICHSSGYSIISAACLTHAKTLRTKAEPGKAGRLGSTMSKSAGSTFDWTAVSWVPAGANWEVRMSESNWP